MKKKILTVIIAAALAVCLAACGDKGPTDEAVSTPTTVVGAQATVTEATSETEAITTTTIAEPTTTTTTTTAAPADLSPAELLHGSWDFVRGDTEEGELTTDYMECRLTFSDVGTVDYFEVLKFDVDDPYDDVTNKEYELPYEIQDVALYDGCPNEDWSVQIFPNDKRLEYYVTVLPDGTMKFMELTYYEDEPSPYMFLADFVKAE